MDDQEMSEIRKRKKGGRSPESLTRKEVRNLRENIVAEQEEGISMLKDTLESMYQTSERLGEEFDEQDRLLKEFDVEIDDTAHHITRSASQVKGISRGAKGTLFISPVQSTISNPLPARSQLILELRMLLTLTTFVLRSVSQPIVPACVSWHA